MWTDMAKFRLLTSAKGERPGLEQVEQWGKGSGGT